MEAALFCLSYILISHFVILQPIKTKETNEFMVRVTLKTLHMTWSATNSPASVDF